jgi:anti-sigma regulatory factor (Ser/Thr protein kinase)
MSGTAREVRRIMKRQSIARFMFPARHSRAEEYALRIEQALPPKLQRLEVRAGLVEALTNAILHGAFGIRRENEDIEVYLDAIEQAERQHAGKTVIGVTVAASEDRADVTVNDFGQGFDWRRAMKRSGRGLSILYEVFDSVRWNAGGNCVRLTISDDNKGEEE